MRKFTKICLIVAFALVCFSVVCISAGAAMGSSLKEVRQMAYEGDFNFNGWHIADENGFFYWDWDDDELKDTEVLKGVVEESFEVKDIDALDIELDYGYVELKDSDSENITISVDAPKRRSYSCKVEGSVLNLEETTKYPGVNHNSLKADIIIGIPKGTEFKEIELSTDAGKIEISHALHAKEISLDVDAGKLSAKSVVAEKELSLETGAGEIIIDSFSADTVSIDCGVGNMELKGKVKQDLEAACGVGNIDLELEGKEEDYNYDISCGMGSITINGMTYSALGKNKEIDNDASGEISLECGVGAIDVEVEE